MLKLQIMSKYTFFIIFILIIKLVIYNLKISKHSTMFNILARLGLSLIVENLNIIVL